MEAIARARFQRYGRRKVGQVLAQVRGKSVWAAEQALAATPRAAAAMVSKAIRSAAANLNSTAGRELDARDVLVSSAWVGQGPTGQLRRMLPAPQGRSMTFRRKMCHVTVVVSAKT